MKLITCTGNFNSLGVHKYRDVITFSIQMISSAECSLKLYPKDGTKAIILPMKKDENETGIFSIGIRQFDHTAYDYNFIVDKKIVTDPYARKLTGREQWGDKKRLTDSENIKGSFYFSDFHWGNDRLPHIEKQDMLMYKLHVRGFTQDIKGKRYSGLLEGVKRKIPYLKEMGITTLEFMPIYEFEEVMSLKQNVSQMKSSDKINYWGYQAGNYFAPKTSYLGQEHDPNEWKKLIQKLHKNNMECILEMHFDRKTNPHFILDCLRFWSREYHVDGFHLICDDATAQLAAQDLHLSGRKLFYDTFDHEIVSGEKQKGPQIFTYNEEFSYAARKMLNNHGGSLYDFTCQMRRQDTNQGFVNFAANYNGFTLNDLFSYTKKYNEANLEENKDGNDYNYSSNCGQEGETKKKNVINLRKRQIKNALALVFLSQGVPLIWMGDESCNSQNGNNNAYCQDNEIGWKNWENKVKNKQILDYVKKLSEFRKNHPIIHKKDPMNLYDTTGIGFPDLSYHSNIAWMTDFSANQPYIGLLYCDNNSKEKGSRDFVYIAYNFQLTAQEFAIPVLPKDLLWHIAMDTKREDSVLTQDLPALEQKQTFIVQAQSITVLVSKENSAMRSRRKNGRK